MTEDRNNPSETNKETSAIAAENEDDQCYELIDSDSEFVRNSSDPCCEYYCCCCC